MTNGWQPGGPLNEVWSHLHCAVVVAIASDSEIVMGHVEQAFKLMEAERQEAIKEETMRENENQWCGDRPEPDPPRDWLMEAIAIYSGSTRLLAQREHIVALVDRLSGVTMKPFRAQAAAAINTEKRSQVEACLDVAERVGR